MSKINKQGCSFARTDMETGNMPDVSAAYLYSQRGYIVKTIKK